VTGASGFLGSEIVLQLLNDGYNVRVLMRLWLMTYCSAARGNRVPELTELYKGLGYGDRASVVEIADISKGEFPDVFQAVDALVHTAAPSGLSGRADTETILAGAIEGTMNVVRQAEKAGIKNIVVTGSIVNVWTSTLTFSDKDWYPITREEALKQNGNDAYRAGKTLAEQELWEFSDSHPHLEVTTLLPPMCYGPLAATQPIPTGNFNALSTNLFLHRLLHPKGDYPITNMYVDTRDVARAHVLALKSKSASIVGRKRIVIMSPHELDIEATLEYVGKQRPELKERLSKESSPGYPSGIPKLVNFGRIEEVLGFKKEEFRTVEETVLDTVDTLLELEKKWEAAGIDVQIPLGDGTRTN
ncbi:hypothetical protein H0H93_010711, partial [Arthromyces matolae]